MIVVVGGNASETRNAVFKVSREIKECFLCQSIYADS